MRFLGVDGGGTKTEFLIIDERGNILSRSIKSTSHYKQTSFSNFKEVLESGVRDVCDHIDLLPQRIDYSFIGIPGFGEIDSDVDKLEAIVEEVLGSKNYKCGNDSEAAWAGSLACNPGINIVAGTGAIGFGVDSRGKIQRASGWGDLCGDEGSAYWISLKLIEAFTKQSDGRMEKTPLYRIFKEELKIEDDFEILDIVLNKFERRRDKIASLASILFIAAEAGDPMAAEIYKDAAREHFLIIKSLVEKMDFKKDKEIFVSYSGGVFKAKKYVLEPLESLISEYRGDIKLIKPILDPASGAALYALKIYGEDVKRATDRLENQ
nr:BadF/BadG/BcrA/BcrD ATPase family protein [Tissierella sp.]